MCSSSHSKAARSWIKRAQDGKWDNTRALWVPISRCALSELANQWIVMMPHWEDAQLCLNQVTKPTSSITQLTSSSPATDRNSIQVHASWQVGNRKQATSSDRDNKKLKKNTIRKRPSADVAIWTSRETAWKNAKSGQLHGEQGQERD